MAREDFETDGMRNGQPIYCPVNGWDCPYFGDGICHIADPMEDCDDFSVFWDSWDEYDNYDEDIPDDVDESNYDPYLGCDFFESDECL